MRGKEHILFLRLSDHGPGYGLALMVYLNSKGSRGRSGAGPPGLIVYLNSKGSEAVQISFILYLF